MFSGSSRVTADGVVGTSGKPLWVTSIVVHSGGTGGDVLLKNGTATGDTEYDLISGSANISVRVEYEGGLFFPGGLYYDEDANVEYTVVNYRQGT